MFLFATEKESQNVIFCDSRWLDCFIQEVDIDWSCYSIF